MHQKVDEFFLVQVFCQMGNYSKHLKLGNYSEFDSGWDGSKLSTFMPIVYFCGRLVLAASGVEQTLER